MVQGVPGVSLRQRARLLQAQQAFLSEFPVLNAEEAAARRADLPVALSVDIEGRTSYPSFQFGDAGVKPIIFQLQIAFGQKVQDWALALWLISANGWLNGARPIDLLDERPEAVLEAADRAAAEIL